MVCVLRTSKKVLVVALKSSAGTGCTFNYVFPGSGVVCTLQVLAVARCGPFSYFVFVLIVFLSCCI